MLGRTSAVLRRCAVLCVEPGRRAKLGQYRSESVGGVYAPSAHDAWGSYRTTACSSCISCEAYYHTLRLTQAYQSGTNLGCAATRSRRFL
eukprot:2001982-Rhodomonas_salina.4